MNTDLRAAALLRTEEIIAEHGWAVQGVLGGPQDGGGFSYTIGLSRTLGHPEIFIAGFDHELQRRLLNDVGRLIKDGEDFSRPRLADRVVRDFNVAFRPLLPASVQKHGGIGLDVLGDFDAVQMFLPDPSGKFPWDLGCKRSYVTVQTYLLEVSGPIPGSDEHRAGLN